MDSDMPDADRPNAEGPNSDRPSPQDPARFSKPKAAPPILDLQAEKPATADEAGTAESARRDTLDLGKPAKPRGFARRLDTIIPKIIPWIKGFVGGMIGGGIAALVLLVYLAWNNKTDQHLATLQLAMASKADQSETLRLAKVIADLDASVSQALADLKSSAATRATDLAELGNRIDAVKAALDAKIESETGDKIDARIDRRIDAKLAAMPESTATPSRDGEAALANAALRASLARLTLALSVRQAIAEDRPIDKDLAALQNLGETGNAFAALKESAASPLSSYAMLIALVDDKSNATKPDAVKTPDSATGATAPAAPTESVFMRFINRFVTIKSADKDSKAVAPVAAQADLSRAPIIAALTARRAAEALDLLRALPDAARAELKTAEAELARRAAAERASATLADEAIDRIVAETKR